MRISILIAFVCASLFGLQGAIQAPSDLLSKVYPPDNMSFVLRIKDDLRELYCNRETIKARQQRKVCRIDSGMAVKLRQEVPVSTNDTVATVLKSIGMTNWNGGRQIRLIKKNGILQSEFPRLGGGDANQREFANTRIAPADIVVICPFD